MQAHHVLATVQKIVSEILPPQTGVSFAKEARDLLIECCVEFITLISSEANEISEKEAKKTIACDHITKALERLGFSDYVPAVLEAAAEHKEVQKVRACLPFPKRHCGLSMTLTSWTGPREEGGQVCQQRHVHGGARSAAGRAICRSQAAPHLMGFYYVDILTGGGASRWALLGVYINGFGGLVDRPDPDLGLDLWGSLFFVDLFSLC